MFNTSYSLPHHTPLLAFTLVCLFSFCPGNAYAEDEVLARPVEAGDSNGDGLIDQRDIQPFVLAVADMDRYRKRFPFMPYLRVHDLNQDQFVDLRDLDEFACLLGEQARNRFLELGPVPGLTQGNHPAPTVTAIPSGSQVPLRVLVHDIQREHRKAVKQIRWEGATPGEDSSRAVADFCKPRLHTIKAWAEWQTGGEELVAFGTYLVEDTPAADVQFEILDIAGLPFTVVEGASNRETKAAFFAPESIADVKWNEGYLCTTTERTLQVDVRSTPGGFAPLAELTVNGTPTGMGALDTFVCHDPGSIWLRVGSIHQAEPVLMDIYRTLLVEPPPGSSIPLERPVDFRAITEPAGFEDQIVWLSSTHFGTASPTLGRGPNFRATFRDARGRGGFAWVGVRCNETVLESDSEPPCEVSFKNDTRCSDRVVSAKDAALGLPGGTKSLEVTVVAPVGSTATLTIRRIDGTTGSAEFVSTGAATRTVKGTQRITIKGCQISDKPRNMEIEAVIDGERCGAWKFTVFRIDPEAFITGQAKDVWKGTELTKAGFGPKSLLQLYKERTTKEGRLGHVHVSGEIGYGGIIIRGKVVPSGMNRADFNLKHSRSKAFNWTLLGSSRVYDEDGCLNENPPVSYMASDNISRDLDDFLEDLLPDSDGTPGELFIWIYDKSDASKDDMPKVGDIARYRGINSTMATYASTKVSKSLSWYWRSSFENKSSTLYFDQKDDIAGDNQLGLGNTPLTSDLGPSQTTDIFVTASEPGSVKRGQTDIRGVIHGRNFRAANPCNPVVYMIGEGNSDTCTLRFILRLDRPFVVNTSIEGRFKSVPSWAPAGPYLIKVFLRDRVKTSPNVVKVVE